MRFLRKSFITYYRTERFSSSIDMQIVISDLLGNPFMHILQEKSFVPVWIQRCLIKLDFLENSSPHAASQIKDFPTVWILAYTFNSHTWENVLLHPSKLKVGKMLIQFRFCWVFFITYFTNEWFLSSANKILNLDIWANSWLRSSETKVISPVWIKIC